MLKKISLILLGLMMGLLAMEVGLRLLGNWLPDGLRYQAGLTRFHAQNNGVFLPDPYLWHRGAPNINRLVTGHPDYDYRVQTNSLGYEDIGFRDDGVDAQPFAIALGDSYTWGDGVDNDKTWVELLEAGTGLDVVNLGVSGYGSLQRLRVLQTYGLPLKPRLVLWSFFPNDFYDDWHFAWREETGRLARRGDLQPNPGWAGALDLNMRRFSVAYDWAMIPFSESEDEEEWERLFYADRTLDLTFVMRPYWEKRLDLSDERVARGKELAQQALWDAQAAADEADATLVVLLFPFKEQVYWPIVSSLVDDPAVYEITGPADEVKAWCEAREIPYLDLTPVLLEHASSGEQLYFRYDAHWNEAGHALVASAIHQYLLESGLIQ